ncbi:hypothetical protein E3N88_17811 [Mikania micrantha]|uniref:Uncharacterized protein n=1 Tax=Mikania micrantha TaxID=192012 RepID=A0A5N6NV49_9ASTR|nr:hypothetical protein E3N88_17811 [Mikania micrantha]
MDKNTSPPANIITVKTTSWVLEKDSISTVDMLETVAAETEVKNKSKFVGVKVVVLPSNDRRTQNPKDDMTVKYNNSNENLFELMTSINTKGLKVYISEGEAFYG